MGNAFLFLTAVVFLLLSGKVPTINFVNGSQTADLLNVDINTNLIEFERIASTIESMPSGGFVHMRRRLVTVKLAMRAILDGIDGDFLETVMHFYTIFKSMSILINDCQHRN